MAIILEDIHLQMQNHVVFHDLNLLIPDAPLVSLVGANGIGKTLILMMIHGLIKPQTGKIIFEDKNSESHQSFIFQKPIILNRSVWKNMIIACPDESRCEEFLRKMHLYNKRKVYAPKLSGGEQQRLSIARSLAMQPKLLIMDEPTTYLDTDSLQLLTNEIHHAKGNGMKMLLVSHDAAFVEQMSDIVIEVPNRKLKKSI